MYNALKIKYLSHGVPITGGDTHELFFVHTLEPYAQTQNQPTSLTIHNQPKTFTNIWQQLKLFLWAFYTANADVNIVVARLGLPAIARNLFNKNKVIIVLHGHYPNANCGFFTRKLVDFTYFLLKKKAFKRFALVCLLDYWQDYFTQKKGIQSPVFVFPNFFELQKYRAFIAEKLGKKQVYLGQFSTKNDMVEIDLLCSALKAQDFRCVFSSLYTSHLQEKKHENYEIVVVSYENYLGLMAESCCTIAFSKIPEGLNRIAVESLLVGTPVVGFDMGGLGYLLKKTNSLVVRNHKEALPYITGEKKMPAPNTDFLVQFDVSNTEQYIKPIFGWITDGKKYSRLK